MKRLAAVALAVATVAALAARAQSPAVRPTEICLLYTGPAAALAPRLAAFQAGLVDQGLAIGRDVAITAHAASFDLGRLAQMSGDCVARNVRVIAAVSPTAVAAARAATRDIPIVALDLESDPVAAGLAESLARPGGNVTGIYFDFPGFAAKWLELVNEASPGIKRIGVLWDPKTSARQIAAVRTLATDRGLALIEQEIIDLPSLEARFKALAEGGAQAVLVLSSPFVGSNTKPVAALAAAYRLPAITMFPEFAESGGLMAYGPDLIGLFRPFGEAVGKVVKGAKPATLPIDRPTHMRLIINLATAKALGMILSPSLLGRADAVIE